MAKSNIVKGRAVIGTIKVQQSEKFNPFQTGHGMKGQFKTRNSKGSEKNLAKKEIRSYGF